MPYEYTASSANPRLLILLTDESEESVKIVNRIIDRVIQINFDGDAPKNRCFISVIGYNHNVRDLCSGWLKDLDASLLLRTESQMKKVSDGVGGLIEVEVKQPVWIESTKHPISIDKYDKAVYIAQELSQKWSEDNYLSPIIIDCSEESHANHAQEEIRQLKAITTRDGNVLFFGCHSKSVDVFEIYSKVPEEWKYKFRILDIAESDYYDGLFNREHLDSILSAIWFH